MNALSTTRRRAENHDLRRLVLAGNLLATLLENLDQEAYNAFSRSVSLATDAWEHAVAAIRKNEEARHA